MGRDSVAVIGTGLAGLVAAHELGRAGRRVNLCGSRRRAGGHFAGVEVEGRTFDLGMVLLEFTSLRSDPSSRVASYDPSRHGDAGRLVTVVERFVRELGLPLRRLTPPGMVLGGRVLRDLVLSNDLEALRDIPEGLRRRIREEVGQLAAEAPRELHASRKGEWGAERDLRSVSLANHGATLHEALIEPLCRKIANTGSDRLLGRFHRSVWAPLYYPESLREVCDGKRAPFAPAAFWTIEGEGGVRRLPEVLSERIRSMNGVTWRDAEAVRAFRRDGAISITLQSGEEVKACEVVWGVGADLLGDGGAPPPPARTSLGFVFARVRTQDLLHPFTVLHLLDDEDGFYRVTAQGTDGGGLLTRLVGEYNVDFAAACDLPRAGLQERLGPLLQRLNLLRDGSAPVDAHRLEFRHALPLPTREGLEVAGELRRRAAECFPEVHLVGAAAPFGAGSMNDQILQGLKAAEILSTP